MCIPPLLKRCIIPTWNNLVHDQDFEDWVACGIVPDIGDHCRRKLRNVHELPIDIVSCPVYRAAVLVCPLGEAHEITYFKDTIFARHK